ncbi:MAG TPA: class I SAM-dependent methyltransferase [Bryobacteraceae bacterium]|nr:class I SAM-dependent methyltransferase [Bryobacteraceae bacterium]
MRNESESAAFPAAESLPRSLSFFSRLAPEGIAWEFQMPDGAVLQAGSGAPSFRIQAANAKGMAAMKSLDEVRIASAYINGDLNLRGDLFAALDLRSGLIDRFPLARFWNDRILPLFRGQVTCDKEWIQSHYNEDPRFYELFLDRRYRCYSQAEFASPTESLEDAMERKMNTAFEWANLRPGCRVLDIGAGWGSFVEFAGNRGIHVTSLTISTVSERYVSELIARLNLNCRVICEHFLEFRSDEPFDAIVNLGVTEHLPDYPATLRQYEKLLKPGGRVYLDASAARARQTTATATLIYAGNGHFLDIAEYIAALQNSSFDLIEVRNGTEDYRLTMEAWARNLDNARDVVTENFGERQYRRFQLYLWAGTHSLATGGLQAYQMALRKRPPR